VLFELTEPNLFLACKRSSHTVVLEATKNFLLCLKFSTVRRAVYAHDVLRSSRRVGFMRIY
jgi:hypothetical protein